MALSPINLSDIAAGTGGFVIRGRDPGDRFGTAVASAGDINGDGYDDLIIGAPLAAGAGNARALSGESYVIFGSAGGFSATIDLADIAAGVGGFALFGQSTGDESGGAVASAGDINGDGIDDLIIGAPQQGNLGTGDPDLLAGRTYVMFGRVGGPITSVDLGAIADGTNGFVIDGQSGTDTFSGQSVASAGDINGDGLDDLVIGVPYAVGAGGLPLAAGRSYVLFGSNTGFSASISLPSLAAGIGGFVIYGEDGSDLSGWSVTSAGDINGDGHDELIIGAPHAASAGNARSLAGDSYVVFGHAGGFGAGIHLSDIAAGTGGFVVHGQEFHDESGTSVASAGDVNGDGFDDLIIGAPGGDAAANGKSGAGDTYVVFGKAGGFGASLDLTQIAGGIGGFVIFGQDITDGSGISVSGAGDINGDGIDDLLIGANHAAGAANATPDSGDIYVVFGKSGAFRAPVDLENVAAGLDGFVIHGEASGDLAGSSVAAAGDIDGDGFADIVIGAPLSAGDGGASPGSGSGYVVLGRNFTGSVTHPGGDGNDTLIGTILADDMVGGRGNDTLYSFGGADALIGGAGDDRIHIVDTGFLRVDGGSGFDTLALDGAGLALDLTTIPNTRVQGIERIDITGSGHNVLKMSAQEVLRLSDTSNTVTINGDAGDIWNAVDTGWVRGEYNDGFVTWTRGLATVNVDERMIVACFAAGTAIAVPGGSIAVERLRAGDLVRTRDGRDRPVRWIGSRALDLTRHPDPTAAQPIRVRAGALADGVPARDLLLSPDHALFIAGGLVPVRLLVNGGSIARQAGCRSVTYFHIELDSHDILLAEGAPAESYLDTGNRGLFDNASAPLLLHPDFRDGQAQRVGQSCAPFLDRPAEVEPIWQALRTRSVALGLPVAAPVLTTDPGLLIRRGDRLTAPVSVAGDRFTFVLPPSADPAYLVSRACAPDTVRPFIADRRRLGVAVRALSLRTGDDVTEVPLDHPALTDGWWDLEHDAGGAWRWTNGQGRLPRIGGGPTMLEITATPQHAYLTDDRPAARSRAA